MLWNVSYQTSQFAGRSRWLRGIFGGWQLSNVFLAKAGTPFSVQSGSDAPGFGNVDGQQSDNPFLLDPSILGASVDHPDTAAAQLPRSAFAFIQPGDRRGNLGRNTFRRDGDFQCQHGAVEALDNLRRQRSAIPGRGAQRIQSPAVLFTRIEADRPQLHPHRQHAQRRPYVQIHPALQLLTSA